MKYVSGVVYFNSFNKEFPWFVRRNSSVGSIEKYRTMEEALKSLEDCLGVQKNKGNQKAN